MKSKASRVRAADRLDKSKCGADESHYSMEKAIARCAKSDSMAVKAAARCGKLAGRLDKLDARPGKVGSSGANSTASIANAA